MLAATVHTFYCLTYYDFAELRKIIIERKKRCDLSVATVSGDPWDQRVVYTNLVLWTGLAQKLMDEFS